MQAVQTQQKYSRSRYQEEILEALVRPAQLVRLDRLVLEAQLVRLERQPVLVLLQSVLGRLQYHLQVLILPKSSHSRFPQEAQDQLVRLVRPAQLVRPEELVRLVLQALVVVMVAMVEQGQQGQAVLPDRQGQLGQAGQLGQQV